MPCLEIRLLGRPDFRYDAGPVVLSHRRETIPLVAYLLAAARDGDLRDHVAAALWPGEPRAKALTTLRHAIHRAVAGLPDAAPGRAWLEVSRRAVRWNPEADYWLDVDAFLALTESADRRRWAPGAEVPDADEVGRLEQAVALYRGELLTAFDFEWLAEPRATCLHRYAAALRRLAAAYDAAGRRTEARELLGRSLVLDPGDEDAVRRLMRIFAAQGDRIAALQVYERLLAHLAGEMGTEPEPETTEARDELRRWPAVDRAIQDDEPALAGMDGQAMIGREAERAELLGALGETRLVSVVGPPGSGKSWLAMAGVHAARERFADGVVWIDGAEIENTRQLLKAIAAVLDDIPPPREGAGEEDRSALVVLDNATHLVDAIATAVERLKASRPQVRVLVTAQAPLRLHTERVIRLASEPPRRREGVGADEGWADDFERPRSAGGPPWQRSLGATCARSVGLLADDERDLLTALAAEQSRASDARESTRAWATAKARESANAWFSLAEAEDLWNRQAGAGPSIESSADRTNPARTSPAGGFERNDAIANGRRAAVDLLGVLIERSLVETKFGPDGEARCRLWPPLVAYFAAERSATDSEAAGGAATDSRA